MFISFEGGEGSGKTTIIESLYQNLQAMGYKVLKTREPGGSRIAEEIRNVILNVENLEMDPWTEALLYAASRRQHTVEVIRPALEAGKIVLCDRYLDSSLAYQGVGRGLGIEEVWKINQYATEGLLPDLTLYIDVKPEVGLSRIRHSERKLDRLDLEKEDFHDTVRTGYLKLVAMFPERIKVVNGNRTIEVIAAEIMDLIIERLRGTR
jgi:dTMP kinase